MSLVSLVRTTYFGDHVEVYREYYDPEGRFVSEVEIRERVPARRPGPAPHPDSLLPPIEESPEDPGTSEDSATSEEPPISDDPTTPDDTTTPDDPTTPEDPVTVELPTDDVVTEIAIPGTSQSKTVRFALAPEPATELQLSFEGSDLEDDNEDNSDPEVLVVPADPGDAGTEDPDVLVVPDNLITVDVYEETEESDKEEESDFDEDPETGPYESTLRGSSASRGTKRKRRLLRKNFCPVCHTRIRQRLRRHAELEHVPWFLTPNRACWQCHQTAQSATFCQYRHLHCGDPSMKDGQIPEFVELCNGVLETLREALSCDDWNELLQVVVGNGWYPQEPSQVRLSLQQKIYIWLWERENAIDLRTPFAEIRINPPSSVGCMLHFKVLLCILAHLPADVQRQVQEGTRRFRGPARHQRKPMNTSDAHAHVDCMEPGKLEEYIGSRWDSSLRLHRIIGNFVSPYTWVDFTPWMEHPKVYGTVGLHPVKCLVRNAIKQYSTVLRDLTLQPKCVGFGEVGLDYFRGPPSSHSIQQDNLRELLQLRPRHLPIILHVRDELDGSIALRDAIRVILETTNPRCLVMVHCFLAGASTRDMLVNALPNTYFSIGPKALSLPAPRKAGLEAALRGVTLDHILLETDFPFLTKHPRRSLQEVAAWVGRIKGVCPTVMLEASRRNVHSFFGLPATAEDV